MINRNTRAMLAFARSQASQSAAVLVFARDTVSGFLTTAHHTVMILGIGAIAALALMFVKPEVADHVMAFSPFHAAQAGEQTMSTPTLSNLVSSTTPVALENARKADITEKQQKLVTTWLSKKYRVAGDATDMLVRSAYDTAREIRLDPLLILAVMAIESGLNPFAESPVGAQGLMQVMSKIHYEKFVHFGGVKAALNPATNIRVGSLILKDYVTRGGSVEAGLKMYVGAANFDTDFGYGNKVLAEYRRLQEVATGRKVPLMTTTAQTRTVPEIVPQTPLLDQGSNTQLVAL